MKKIFIIGILLIVGLFATGCEKVSEGKYKEGTYFASVIDNYNNQENEATATIYVNEQGVLKSVVLDTTYPKEKGSTTKKALGNDYNMKKYSSATKEWFEQIELLEKKILDEQGIDFIKWTDTENSTTDSVSGVTIKIDALYKAVDNALKQAQK